MIFCTRCPQPHPLPNAPKHLPDGVEMACRRSLGIMDKPGRPANLDAIDANLTMHKAWKGRPTAPDKRGRPRKG